MKMRLIFATAVMVGLLLFGAASAHAIAIGFGAPSSTTVNVGDTFTIDLVLDTEGETKVTSVFVSVFADPGLFTYVGGVSPGAILLSFSSFENIPRIVDPYVLGTDPAGQIRAASFSTLTPWGALTASSYQVLATLTFQALDSGVGSLVSLAAQGDDVTVSLVTVLGSVSFNNSAQITIVPEPNTVLLIGLGLVGLAVDRRRTQP